jgi:hypothetical protein
MYTINIENTMNYITSAGKYLRWYKRYKRGQYQDAFDKCVLKYLQGKPYLCAKQSACKRFYFDMNNSIIWRMDYKTSYKMGFKNYNMTLEERMKYYDKKKFHIIVIDLYVSLSNPRISIDPIDECYLTCLRNDHMEIADTGKVPNGC